MSPAAKSDHKTHPPCFAKKAPKTEAFDAFGSHLAGSRGRSAFFRSIIFIRPRSPAQRGKKLLTGARRAGEDYTIPPRRIQPEVHAVSVFLPGSRHCSAFSAKRARIGCIPAKRAVRSDRPPPSAVQRQPRFFHHRHKDGDQDDLHDDSGKRGGNRPGKKH